VELQGYLHGISYYNPNIPRIIPDGIYGPETVAAVKDFQLSYGLTETGEVNTATWNKIVLVYKAFVDTPAQPLTVFPKEGGQVISAGNAGFSVLVIQSILHSLAEKYHNLPPVAVTGSYELETLQAVQIFQKMSVLPVTGNVDRKTWNMLAAAADGCMGGN
jgi:peptidoglycan hydrolase-like protein with peptidoglycan-binding domain